MAVSHIFGLVVAPRCCWCFEDAGWCDQTGGPNPCDSDPALAAAATREAFQAPLIRQPFRPARASQTPAQIGPAAKGHTDG